APVSARRTAAPAPRSEAGAGDLAGPEDAYLFERSSVGPAYTAATFAKAGAQARALARTTRRATPKLASAEWQFRGPTNIGGRIVDIALDPKRVGVAYAAAASG